MYTGSTIAPLTRVEKHQRYYYYPQDGLFVMRSTSHSLDIPFADTFLVIERWVVQQLRRTAICKSPARLYAFREKTTRMLNHRGEVSGMVEPAAAAAAAVEVVAGTKDGWQQAERRGSCHRFGVDVVVVGGAVSSGGGAGVARFEECDNVSRKQQQIPSCSARLKKSSSFSTRRSVSGTSDVVPSIIIAEEEETEGKEETNEEPPSMSAPGTMSKQWLEDPTWGGKFKARVDFQLPCSLERFYHTFVADHARYSLMDWYGDCGDVLLNKTKWTPGQALRPKDEFDFVGQENESRERHLSLKTSLGAGGTMFTEKYQRYHYYADEGVLVVRSANVGRGIMLVDTFVGYEWYVIEAQPGTGVRVRLLADVVFTKPPFGFLVTQIRKGSDVAWAKNVKILQEKAKQTVSMMEGGKAKQPVGMMGGGEIKQQTATVEEEAVVPASTGEEKGSDRLLLLALRAKRVRPPVAAAAAAPCSRPTDTPLPAPTKAPASPAAEKKPRATLAPPVRRDTNEKMSESVTFANVVYLAGQVTEDSSLDITGQTESVLKQIDQRLAGSFSDKTKIIKAEIFLKNLEDFGAFNATWIKWIEGHGPARATVQANLVDPKWLIEIVVTAAICKDLPKSASAAAEGDEDEEEATGAAEEESETPADKKAKVDEE
ncbi:hypothetical protein BASA81_011327 [Batrachochytrium salamandrivorans]|nr:hypothetical protein BASA81_011327 [Batrachochytrium salamandrivorans]